MPDQSDTALPLRDLAERVREDVGVARFYQDGSATTFKEDALAALDQLVAVAERFRLALQEAQAVALNGIGPGDTPEERLDRIDEIAAVAFAEYELASGRTEALDA